MPYALERLKYLGEGISFKGVTLDRYQRIQMALVVNDSQDMSCPRLWRPRQHESHATLFLATKVWIFNLFVWAEQLN